MKVRRRCEELQRNLTGVVHDHLLEAIMLNDSLRIPRVLLEGLRLRLDAPVSDFISDEDPLLLQIRERLDELRENQQRSQRIARPNSILGIDNS
ncbi:MAG TPA: hypothetical protein PLD54_02540 [Candidatus Levybacteria bacterium]|nr:hypothetical protein [Candidatus Levybacteria bacterium]